MYGSVSTPMYVAQNRFDSDQSGAILGLDWWPLPLVGRDDAKRDYLRYFGRQTMSGIVARVLNSSKKGDGVFAPSCNKHTGNLCMKPSATAVRGVRYAQSVWDWFVGAGLVPHQLVDDCAGDDPCNSHCDCD